MKSEINQFMIKHIVIIGLIGRTNNEFKYSQFFTNFRHIVESKDIANTFSVKW